MKLKSLNTFIENCPCINCITLPVCRNKIQQYDDIIDMNLSCNILLDYMNAFKRYKYLYRESLIKNVFKIFDDNRIKRSYLYNILLS